MAIINMQGKITIRNRPQVEREIVREVGRILEIALEEVKPKIRENIFVLVNQRIQSSPEYAAMQPGGTLYGQLGVVQINSAVEQIIREIADNAVVTSSVRPAGRSFSGKINIGILKDDYSDLLSIPASHFMSENGHNVEWLRYLLLEGTNIIFANYSFQAFGRKATVQTRKGPRSLGKPKVFSNSRTGEGIMLKGRNRSRWTVPAEYSGVATDNWLTRALLGLDEQITKILSEDIVRRLT